MRVHAGAQEFRHADRPPPLRLPARLPVGVRARRRGDRRGAHRPRPRRGGPSLHGGRRLREGGALRRAHPQPEPADDAAAPHRPQGLRRSFAPISWDEALDRTAEGSAEGRARARRGERLALFLRRHDGPRHARRDRAADPRQALLALFRRHLHRRLLARLHRRDRHDARRQRRRDREDRLPRHLGHQRGRDPGQSDDPRDARPQAARRQDRRHRHLRQRDDAAGRSGAEGSGRAPTARSPAPSCMSLFRDGLADRDYMARHTDAPEALEAHLADKTPAWAAGHHRA